jgi:hypothetical protein
MACPEFRSKLTLRLSQFQTVQSADFFSEGPRIEIRLLSVNSLPESGSVSRGATTFDIFRVGVRQSKLMWASLLVLGAE